MDWAYDGMQVVGLQSVYYKYLARRGERGRGGREMEKKIGDVNIGEAIILYNYDTATDCIAILKTGGRSGGAKYDKYMAWQGDVTSDCELDRVATDQEEADKYEIDL